MEMPLSERTPGLLPDSELRTHSKRGNYSGDENNADELQFVELILGQEHYAVNLFHIREVITQAEITPLPNTPPYIKELMDLRGSITTIIDLKVLMNLTDDTATKKRSRVIILDRLEGEKSVGILVDDVISVSTHDSSDIDRYTEENLNSRRNILGVIKKKIRDKDRERHKLILWLDIQAILRSVENDL